MTIASLFEARDRELAEREREFGEVEGGFGPSLPLNRLDFVCLSYFFWALLPLLPLPLYSHLLLLVLSSLSQRSGSLSLMGQRE